MHIESIHSMLECLSVYANAQLEYGVENLNTCEFGKVADIIKDLSEAEYYSKVSKAMTNESDLKIGKLHSESGYSQGYQKGYSEGSTKDDREGRAGNARVSLISTLDLHDTNSQKDKQDRSNAMQQYLMSLAEDIDDLFEYMSDEERQVFKSKMNNLIAQM